VTLHTNNFYTHHTVRRQRAGLICVESGRAAESARRTATNCEFLHRCEKTFFTFLKIFVMFYVLTFSTFFIF